MYCCLITACSSLYLIPALLYMSCTLPHVIHLQLSSDGRRVIDPEGNKLTVFNTTAAQDSGIYTCLAMNSAGTARYAVLVTIQDAMS